MVGDAYFVHFPQNNTDEVYKVSEIGTKIVLESLDGKSLPIIDDCLIQINPIPIDKCYFSLPEWKPNMNTNHEADFTYFVTGGGEIQANETDKGYLLTFVNNNQLIKEVHITYCHEVNHFVKEFQK